MWGNLHRDWKKCGNGQSQSPIDIIDYNTVYWHSLGALNLHYKPARAMIKNRGHDIEVLWTGDAGGIIIGGSEYKLKQCHWHIPSEHTINGARFNLELHVVHINSHGDYAVVGILYMIGLPDPFLASLSSHIGSATSNGSDIGIVDPWSIRFPKRPEYYRYNGSLTTPPCSENVTWTVIRTIRTASQHQITALRNAVHDRGTGNARPLQPLNGRTVYLFRPKLVIRYW
ncbi:alpha carbonic anhydrase 7 [Phtheirospermum japonicum]|uniref:Carbonic anhydrase n=1 Tax=Phtheirospermum japonicum TaxID=374723 RepID=A0A830BX13_9LAMI|nr:alpha carbonic anhydrase 7 [Phtheirospermum japonicum]